MKKFVSLFIVMIMVLSIVGNVFADVVWEAEYKQDLNEFIPSNTATAYRVFVNNLDVLKFNVKVTGKGFNNHVYVNQDIKLDEIEGKQEKVFLWKTCSNKTRSLTIIFEVNSKIIITTISPTISLTPATISPTVTSITPTNTNIIDQSPIVTSIPDSTVAESTTVVDSADTTTLPKTGEESNVVIYFIGIAIIIFGIGVGLIKKFIVSKE